nr:MAG TPA: Toxin Ibs, type I toxin-antitoxin system [Caudoviricetes sp.]
MMEYVVITMLAIVSFTAGWIIRSISVDRIVQQAKYDIQHVNELKQKEYKRGWSTGFGYGSEYEK